MVDSSEKECVFCKIISGEIPSHKIWEDENHLAFLTIFPNTPGFTVVATKKHLPSYAFENRNKDLISLALATKKVAKLIDGAFDDVGRTGMFFEGFGVDHFHSKLFPMHGTGTMKQWEQIEFKDEKVFFDKYPGYITTQESKRADDKELKIIANKIRKIAKEKKNDS